MVATTESPTFTARSVQIFLAQLHEAVLDVQPLHNKVAFLNRDGNAAAHPLSVLKRHRYGHWVRARFFLQIDTEQRAMGVLALAFLPEVERLPRPSRVELFQRHGAHDCHQHQPALRGR